ncbi:MAG TPA: hypothetical protein VFI31_22200 [Pirellulales bacterium]|nr:hypothetical protein [Pirellulales bacterium]
MTSHEPQLQATPRRWLQVRLATILIVIAGLCAWLAYFVNRGHRERMAIVELDRAGVYATTASNAPDWAPAWLDRACFQFVIAVNCSGPNGWRQNDFGHVSDPSAPLSDIELYFLLQADQGDRHDGRIVTDELMPNIAAFRNCKALYLTNAKISDRGFAHLAALKEIQLLWANGTQITDAGLEHLSNKMHLRHLVFYDTAVTDEVAEKLQRLLPDCHIVR